MASHSICTPRSEFFRRRRPVIPYYGHPGFFATQSAFELKSKHLTKVIEVDESCVKLINEKKRNPYETELSGDKWSADCGLYGLQLRSITYLSQIQYK